MWRGRPRGAIERRWLGELVPSGEGRCGYRLGHCRLNTCVRTRAQSRAPLMGVNTCTQPECPRKVYRKDIHPDGLVGGPFPLLLTGYGAYGSCSDPDFDGNRLSLLDRGCDAIEHAIARASAHWRI